MNFGEAVEALKQGKRVSRDGWNGKGLFIFQQVPSSIPMDVVPRMQSLPQSVKDEFERRKNVATDNGNMIMGNNNPLNSIRYCNQLALVYPDNTIYGWVASPSDVLEEDWCILD